MNKGIETVKKWGKHLAVNSFITSLSVNELPDLAKRVINLGASYWLISQYRPINLANILAARRQEYDFSALYGVDDDKFREKAAEADSIVEESGAQIPIFVLPRSTESFPARLWAFADGKIWTDPKDSDQNLQIGDLTKGDTIESLVEEMLALKHAESENVTTLRDTTK